MVIRYQRQEALSTMRQVNKAFGLLNPPSWYEKTVKDVKKAVTGLIGILTHQKQKPIRVSWKDQHCTARVRFIDRFLATDP